MKIFIGLVFPFTLIIIIVTILLIVVGIKMQPDDEGGEDMIKRVYVYLVLFATLMMTIGGSVAAFMAVADIVSPSPYYQSFTEFKNREAEPEYVEKDRGEKAKQQPLSEAELKTRYDAMVAAEKERAINQAKNSLIKSFGWIVIPLPVFIFFQRRLVNQG